MLTLEQLFYRMQLRLSLVRFQIFYGNSDVLYDEAGLIVATGEFFNKAFPQVSYKTYAIVFTLVGFAIANLGLNNIIAFSSTI